MLEILLVFFPDGLYTKRNGRTPEKVEGSGSANKRREGWVRGASKAKKRKDEKLVELRPDKKMHQCSFLLPFSVPPGLSVTRFQLTLIYVLLREARILSGLTNKFT